MDPRQKCESCNKVGSRLLRCSRCGLVYYCNQHCQKKHWKKHKAVVGPLLTFITSSPSYLQCRCFTVRAIADKGLGMVATRTILPGETIITEDPVLVVDMAGTEEDRLESILDQVNKMPADTRARVEDLYDSEPGGDPRLKVVRIFKSNSIQSKFQGHDTFKRREKYIESDQTKQRVTV